MRLRKRDQLKKLSFQTKEKVGTFWERKIAPNKLKVVIRGASIIGFYQILGPTAALAGNETNPYAVIAATCLGNKNKFLGFVPVPRTYAEGAFCVGTLLICGAAASTGFTATPTNVACATALNALSGKSNA